MPMRQGVMFARRCPTWQRDHFWRRMIAPRRSRPATWNEFLPMPITTTAMAVLIRDMGWGSFCSCDPPLSAELFGEHGRTIPLTGFHGRELGQKSGQLGRERAGSELIQEGVRTMIAVGTQVTCRFHRRTVRRLCESTFNRRLT